MRQAEVTGERWDGEPWAGSLDVVTGPPCVVHTPRPAHQHTQPLLPPLPVSHLAAPFRPAVCWGLQVLAVRFSPTPSTQCTTCLLAPPWVAPALVLLGLCENSTNSHPPPARARGSLEAWDSRLFYLPQAFQSAQTVHRSPLSWLC